MFNSLMEFSNKLLLLFSRPGHPWNQYFQHMGMIKILFFLLFLLPIIHAAEDCSISQCGNNGIPIRFPFRLEGQQPKNCGYPGFDLSCNSQSIPVLKLPYSGEFFVRNVSYLTQQIQIYDPDNCLPRRLLSFNLSGSPFVAALHQKYTFLSCPTQVIKSRLTPISCLSNSTTSVLATSSESLVNSMSISCQIIVTLPVPVSGLVQYDEGYTADLNEDLQLTWYVPNCGDCESEGGICGFESSTSQDIGCFYNQETGQSRNGFRIFKMICLIIVIPAISCAIFLTVVACLMDRNRRGIVANAIQRRSIPAVVLPQPTIVMMGLDESTIESYQKLVLGESRRLPGHNDSTCPICLSEYRDKETLRCIPECEHCFHADCIDEWLRMNNTCPVCRNAPSPAQVTIT